MIQKIFNDRTPGWIGKILLIIITSFWCYWSVGEMYHEGDPLYLNMFLKNQGDYLHDLPTFCILDVFGDYFFWPEWNEFGYEIHDIPAEFTKPIVILPEFSWPGDVGAADGIVFYGACTDPEITDLFGQMDVVTFGWE